MIPPKKTTLYAWAILALSIFVAVLLKWTQPQLISKTQEQARPVIDLFAVHERSLQPTAKLLGRLQPAQKSQLRFELSGRISARSVEPGVHVKTGQVLLTLEDGDSKDALSEAEAQQVLENETVTRDQQLFDLARKSSHLQDAELKRLMRVKGNLVSQSNLDEARQKLYQIQSEEARLKFSVDTAQARLKLRAAALERARRNLSRARLLAPYDGLVNMVAVQTGDYVSPTQVIVEIVSADQVEMYLQVHHDVASALKLGDKVNITVNTKPVLGTVIALQADPDSSTFTHEMRILLPPGLGSPGAVAEVELMLTPLSRVLAVPTTAVRQEHGAAYVLVVDQQQRVARRIVVLGPRIQDLHVVTHGLTAGEKVVRRDLGNLRDGQWVQTRSAQ